MSETSLAASAALEIERPVEVVRAQFFDVDHALRGHIHHGVTTRRLPPGPAGERLIEQEIKVLSRTHLDVFVIEPGDDGAWVRRIVEGLNAGTRFVATFTAHGDAATRVRIEAHVGPAGYHSALGKLSQLGLQKALQKLLEEHRRALVGYEPGRARGAVDAVLASMRELVLAAPALAGGQGRAVMTNLLEAACVVAVADGAADEPERDAMKAVARRLCLIELDDDAIERMVQNVARAAGTEGIEQRCDKIGARLRGLDLAELGVGVAVLVAQISHGIDPPELAALQRVATAAGLGDDALLALTRRIDAELG